MTTDKDKLDSETALVKIKVLMNKYFANIGRGDNKEGLNIGFLEGEIIGDIDEVLDNINIDRKRIIIESLNIDEKRSKLWK